MRITEDIVKRFADAAMKIDIISVNREAPTEETLKETIKIDISCLLFPKGRSEVSYYFSYKIVCLDF